MNKRYTEIIFAFITLFTTQAWSQMNPGPPMNPGFESVNSLTIDWKNTPDIGTYSAIGARSNVTARTGSWSYLSATTVSTSFCRQINVSTLSIPANNYVHLIAWAKGTNVDSKACLGGKLISATGPDNNNGSSGLSTADWTQLPAYNRQNTTAGALNFQCGLYFKSNTAGTSTQVYFDDVIAYTDNVATADITNPTAATASSSPIVSSNSATINWANGTDAGTGIQNTIILRTTNMNAATPVLNNQGMYSKAGGESGPNTVGTDWTVISTSVAASATSYTDNTVSPSTVYQYAVIHRDKAYNYSSALVITAITNFTTAIIASTLPACSTCDITIDTEGELDVNATTTFKSITVAPGAKLTLSSGTLTAINGITLQSNSSATATFVDNNNVAPQTISGIVQQYLPQGRNWYISSPITGANASSLIGESTASSVSYYNEKQSAWVNNYIDAMTPGKGYVAVSSTGSGLNTVSFIGVLNTGNIPVSLSRQGLTKAGFNLVANPYPSYVNAMEAINANANIQSTIWYRTRSGGLTTPTYYFETVNTLSGEGTNISGTGQVTGYLPPMQAFWVRTNVDGAILTFDNTMRYHANPTIQSVTIKTTPMKIKENSTEQNQLVRLQISNGINRDETVLYFNANASDGYDNYDSEKMSNGNAIIPEIFTLVGSEQLALNGMNSIYSATEIPLGFTTGQSGDFSIFASELRNIDAGTQIVLVDKLLNKEVDLSDSSAYNFSSPVTTSSDNRFALQFRVSNISTGTNKALALNANVFTNSSNQIEIVSSENCNYIIYNTLGQKVCVGNKTSNNTIVNGQLESGLYIVELLNGKKIQTYKVIIR